MNVKMVLTTVVLAGALGTGTLGVKVYREEKKKKEYPWTYAAETLRVAPKNGLAARWEGVKSKRPLTKKRPFLLLDGVSRRLSEGVLSTKASLTRVKKQLVKPFAQSLEAQRRSRRDERVGLRGGCGTLLCPLGYKQTHPIARAILQEAQDRKLNLPNIDDAQYYYPLPPRKSS